MFRNGDEQVALSDHEPAELQHYRSVSRLAIAALCAGLASVLALLHPLLWSIPVVALLLAGLACRSIQRNDSAQTGRWMAILALMLALLCGAAAVSYLLVTRGLVARQACTVADQWLDLVRRGKTADALEWTVAPYRRRPPGVDLNAFYENDRDARDTRDRFVEKPIVQTLMELPAEIPLRLARIVEHRHRARQHDFVLRYRAQRADGPPCDCLVSVNREQHDGSGNIFWRIASLEAAE